MLFLFSASNKHTDQYLIVKFVFCPTSNGANKSNVRSNGKLSDANQW